MIQIFAAVCKILIYFFNFVPYFIVKDLPYFTLDLPYLRPT